MCVPEDTPVFSGRSESSFWESFLPLPYGFWELNSGLQVFTANRLPDKLSSCSLENLLELGHQEKYLRSTTL